MNKVKYNISLKNVIKTINKKALLKNINFDIPTGAICAFIGASGSGKTTTIKVMMNLWESNSGEVKMAGLDYQDLKLHYKIGYVPEKENFPKKTALKFLTRMSELYDLEPNVISDRIHYYAKKLEVENILNDTLTNMSSGQKKRIMILQALIHQPQILIMDEPTENLDPNNREAFYKVITDLNKKGTTIFISSHNLAEIEQYIDYVVIIANGEIKHTGPVKKGKGELKKIYEKYK